MTRLAQAAHPSGGVGRREGVDLHGRQRRRFGRGPRAQADAGWSLLLFRAFSPRADQKLLTVQGAMPRETHLKRTLCADRHGYSLHAVVRCGADDRKSLEPLCRYNARPALANERVQTNVVEQVVLKLKTAWRDGTTHLVMSPLEYLQRPAALVTLPLQSVPHSRVTN